MDESVSGDAGCSSMWCVFTAIDTYAKMVFVFLDVNYILYCIGS